MEISTVIEEQDPRWMTPIIEFISKGMLPHEQKDARRTCRTAQRFELRNGVLYRRSFLQPWLRCVGPIQADYVLREIHTGSCIHRPIPRQPQEELTPITSPWPFHKWGIDIAGPFSVAVGGLKFLIVAIDYFTKWIEAIRGSQQSRESGQNDLFGINIVCRWITWRNVIVDNGKQFCDNPFKDWCTRLSITQRFASVKHPQTNGLVERANRSLGEGIKARLDRHKGRWVEELSHVFVGHIALHQKLAHGTLLLSCYGTDKRSTSQN
ncbi:reverse transcriptase domain-containing protein [Tanacetum coccineum]|uniref:Reverse transcriptase domain-containing protein n=1 Tax=Tanacetum coccineum TaxID=301880 RepID=A0ABQ5DU49_9ASTR